MARGAPGNKSTDRRIKKLAFIWRWFLRIAALLIVLLALYQGYIFLKIWYWVDHNPASSAFMDTRRSILQKKSPQSQIQYQWTPYEHISINLKRALIAAEDAKFTDHEGFDWEGIQKAYEKNVRKGKIVAGGSTISQQLAKNLFLSSQKTPWRKIQEAVITLMLEKMMSKRRILEIYMNVIEWGEGVFGAEAAAQHYFGISAKNLSPEQAAKLAAMAPKPRFYETRLQSRGLQRRMYRILARMPAANVP